MNKLQKRLVIFLFILSLGLCLSVFKVLKVAIEEKEKIGGLSLKVDSLTKKGQDLKEKLDGKEKELTKVKANLKNLNFDLKEEKKKVSSFRKKYAAEKEKRAKLGASLNKLKLTLESEKKKREKIAVETKKLREEKKVLSQNLKEMKVAQEALEAFVAEDKEEPTEEKITRVKSKVTPSISTARIVTIYPQGLLGIELQKSPQEGINRGKIVKGDKNMNILNVHSHMIILEVAEGEDLGGFKKDDIIKYIR